jgi:eukaryotic-like serine/threonine-protein kinase
MIRGFFSFSLTYRGLNSYFTSQRLSTGSLIHNMSVATATDLIVEVLGDTRLLPREYYSILINELLPCCDDWGILCQECVYRGWLTTFQAKRLLQGRGRELLVGSYVLLEPLGEGGMGQVFLCRNSRLGNFAALKLIHKRRAGEPASVERFMREVRALGAMRHPNIVHALDADLKDGRLYFAMEYVPGIDLARLLVERGALPIETACRYAAQLAEGLQYITSLGLVHRDVKPGNILVTEDGSSVKLVDLGLARFDHPDWEPAASELTQIGMMIGTPDYVAPEQIRDSRAADIRSDLYSLGCTLYHMLTGRAPFDGSDVRDKLYLQQASEPVPVESLRADIPSGVAALVLKLMAKKPRDRYQDPSEVVASLRPYLIPLGETLTDAVAPTSPGLPAGSNWELPRTDDIPTAGLAMVVEEAEPEQRTWRARLNRWLNRLHWLIAALIAGLAMGVVIGRG